LIRLVLVVWLTADPGGMEGLPSPGAAQDAEPVYLVSHGWHVGLVVRRTDATAAYWPEQDAFTDAVYLEVGWGDAGFYRSPDPGLGTLLKAGLWPTDSVLHIVGFRRSVTAYFPESEILRLELPQAGVEAMAAFIHAAYARDEEGRVMALGPGLYGESRFYAGRDRYHVFNNCNTWTARALQAAGLPVRPADVVTAADLFEQARPFGKTVQP